MPYFLGRTLGGRHAQRIVMTLLCSVVLLQLVQPCWATTNVSERQPNASTEMEKDAPTRSETPLTESQPLATDAPPSLPLSSSVPLPSVCTDGSILAIGDLHGDFYKLQQLLIASGVVTSDGQHWRKDCHATVVQLGDMADRGPHAHTLYHYASVLETEAALEGGEFLFVLGNHELFNLLGKIDYVDPQTVENVFGGEDNYRATFAPTGCYGQYLLAHPVVAVRGGILFVHAGLTAGYARLGVNGINEKFTAAFETRGAELTSSSESRAFHHPFENSNSPVWDSSVISAALLDGDCAPLRRALDAVSLVEGRPIHTMVVGHTQLPNGTPRTDLCGGALVAIDVGLSEALSAVPARNGHAAIPFGYAAMVRLTPAEDHLSLRGTEVVAPWGLGTQLVRAGNTSHDVVNASPLCQLTPHRLGHVLQGSAASRPDEDRLSHGEAPRRPITKPSTDRAVHDVYSPSNLDDIHYGRYGLALTGVILLLLIPCRPGRKSHGRRHTSTTTTTTKDRRSKHAFSAAPTDGNHAQLV